MRLHPYQLYVCSIRRIRRNRRFSNFLPFLSTSFFNRYLTTCFRFSFEFSKIMAFKSRTLFDYKLYEWTLNQSRVNLLVGVIRRIPEYLWYEFKYSATGWENWSALFTVCSRISHNDFPILLLLSGEYFINYTFNFQNIIVLPWRELNYLLMTNSCQPLLKLKAYKI